MDTDDEDLGSPGVGLPHEWQFTRNGYTYSGTGYSVTSGIDWEDSSGNIRWFANKDGDLIGSFATADEAMRFAAATAAIEEPT